MTYREAVEQANRDLKRVFPEFTVAAADETYRTATVSSDHGQWFTNTTNNVRWWVKGVVAAYEIMTDNPSADLPEWAQRHNARTAAEIHSHARSD